MDSLGGQSAFAMKSEDVAARVLREFGVLQTGRGTFESQWQEIAERIWPDMSWKFNPLWGTTPGQKKTEHVVDSTAALALDRFAAILDSLLTPRNQKWHSLSVTDPKVNGKREVREWLEKSRDVLFRYRYQPEANFASQNQMNFKSTGAFGNATMFIDRLDRRYGKKGFRYKSVSLGEIYFVENHQGIVDKAFRYFELTVRQAVQKWGSRIPESISALMEKDPETIFHFLHLVEPRDDWDPERKDHKGMRFASYYVVCEEAKLIEEGGYHTFPYATSRYAQYPGESYGRGPASLLLPTIKTLNEQKRTNLKLGHRSSDPVLLAHDDGVVDGFSLMPGAINPGGVSADGRPLVHALPVGNFSVSKEGMDDERALINDGFLVSLFQILTESPQMTATEVLEKAKEKGILIAPAVGGQQSGYLGPMIHREMDLAVQEDLLPPMPTYLRDAIKNGGVELEIGYDSPLTRAQRAEEASGLMRTVQSCLEVAQVTQDPSVLFHFNWDRIVPSIAEIQGVPLSWMNTMDQVMKMKQNHAAMQQQNAQITAAPGAAALISAGAKAHKAGTGG